MITRIKELLNDLFGKPPKGFGFTFKSVLTLEEAIENRGLIVETVTKAIDSLIADEVERTKARTAANQVEVEDQ